MKDAYDYLSKADVFRGRIRKWQYWRYLVYQSALMNLGVAFSKDKINKQQVIEAVIRTSPTGAPP